MKNLLSLDAHAHVTTNHTDEALAGSGFVLAMTAELKQFGLAECHKPDILQYLLVDLPLLESFLKWSDTNG